MTTHANHAPSNRKHILLDVPESTSVVGSVLRPPRPLTVGRRASDRFIAWALGVFLIACSVFVLYVGWLATDTAQQIRSHVTTCPAP